MLIKLQVTADAPAEKVVKYNDGLYLISVREKAERGEANKRILELVRSMHPGKPVRLVKGHKSWSKIVEIGK